MSEIGQERTLGMQNTRQIKGWIFAALALAVIVAVVWYRWIFFGLFVDVTRPLLCDTTTYRTAVAPGGDYSASIIEVDCGAMSSSHRQVLLRKGLLKKQTVFFFNGAPELDVAWSGQTLLVSGSRPLSSMDHPPPNTVEWEGAVIQYVQRTVN